MALGTILGTCFAAVFLRIFLGLALGEGCGLTFAGAALLLQKTGETFHLRFQFGEASLESLTSLAGGSIHANSIATRFAYSCASFAEMSKPKGGGR